MLLGRYRLGNLIRYIPYPVIGGFLAVLGLILLQGAFSLVADYSFSFSNINVLFEQDNFIRWSPALVFGVMLFFLTRYRSHYLIVPSFLILGIVLFFVVILFSGESVTAVQDDGWMLGPFPEGNSWKPIFLEDLSVIDWDLILKEAWHIPSIALVSAIALMLNISALEIQSDDDIQIKHELQITGVANIGLALGGGFIGFHTLSLTMLGWRMEGKGRLLGVVFGLTFLVVLIVSFSLIAFFPIFVIGGLLIFLGIDILVEWVYEGWFKMSHQDYVIIIMILLAVATIGYLEGVALGILAATVLFAYNYSRIEIVKQALTSKTYRSKVDRPLTHYRELQAAGESLTFYWLNGVIFFGSASSLLDKVVSRLQNNSLLPLQYLVLDFRHVLSVDSSAVLTFIRLNQLLQKQSATLIFSDLCRDIYNIFERSDFDLTDREQFRFFSGFDEAVEWCEEKLLRETSVTEVVFPDSLKGQLAISFPNFKHYDEILPYMERKNVAEGDTIATQGERSTSLYWVESGRLQALIELEESQYRVRIATAGAIMGEIGMYSNKVRSASIVADKPSVVYVLSQESLTRMEDEKPIVAANFHKLVALILAERLADTTDSLRHYLE